MAQGSLHPDSTLSSEHYHVPSTVLGARDSVLPPPEGGHLVFTQTNAYLQTEGPAGDIFHAMKGSEAEGGSEA